VSQINKNDEKKLVQEEKMTNIFKNIHMLHSIECPIQIISSGLKNSSLEFVSSELSKSLNVKLASVGMIQDKQVEFWKHRITFFSLKGIKI
jgi:hypothetical protein